MLSAENFNNNMYFTNFKILFLHWAQLNYKNIRSVLSWAHFSLGSYFIFGRIPLQLIILTSLFFFSSVLLRKIYSRRNTWLFQHYLFIYFMTAKRVICRTSHGTHLTYINLLSSPLHGPYFTVTWYDVDVIDSIYVFLLNIQQFSHTKYRKSCHKTITNNTVLLRFYSDYRMSTKYMQYELYRKNWAKLITLSLLGKST
jgi:hypothetical protein